MGRFVLTSAKTFECCDSLKLCQDSNTEANQCKLFSYNHRKKLLYRNILLQVKYWFTDMCLWFLNTSGTCVCGECSCYDVDPSGDWGDIHGDTCECDERNCHATYDRYTDDFCSGGKSVLNLKRRFQAWRVKLTWNLSQSYQLFYCSFNSLKRSHVA